MTEPVDLDELERLYEKCEDVPRLIAELRDSRRCYRELASEVWCLPPEEAAEAEIDHTDTLAEAKRMNRRIMELDLWHREHLQKPQAPQRSLDSD